MFRTDGRANDSARPIKITPSFLVFPEGSALIEVGETKVICTASVEDRVPVWMRGQGKGWITAEYGMLPRSTLTRRARESGSNRPDGRTYEIQRLIGRSHRSVINMRDLGERTITIDCDVIQADGGTRTAAITGSYVALYEAFLHLARIGTLPSPPLMNSVAAISVGIVEGENVLDLCYSEDSQADVDCNVVMTGSWELVEIQGTAEGKPFSISAMDELVKLAQKGIEGQFQAQKNAIDSLTMLKQP